jgi:hypothetical protein
VDVHQTARVALSSTQDGAPDGGLLGFNDLLYSFCGKLRIYKNEVYIWGAANFAGLGKEGNEVDGIETDDCSASETYGLLNIFENVDGVFPIILTLVGVEFWIQAHRDRVLELTEGGIEVAHTSDLTLIFEDWGAFDDLLTD